MRSKPNGRPDGKYHSWDIKGIPEPVIDQNSQRSAEIDAAEAGNPRQP